MAHPLWRNPDLGKGCPHRLHDGLMRQQKIHSDGHGYRKVMSIIKEDPCIFACAQ